MPLSVVVLGAGAFGGWTALALAGRGARVTLVDAWGPGHGRSSSGGETRIIRATYGSRAIYTTLTMRSLARWRDEERRHAPGLLRECGVLWMSGPDDPFIASSAATLHASGVAFDEITRADAVRRYPQIAFEPEARVWFEPEAGYLLASAACRHVAARAEAAGARLLTAAVAAPASITSEGVALADGTRLAGDVYVFACGPWLGTLFPDHVGARVTPTRQEVHYFGTPAGDTRFDDPALPVWLDCGPRIRYGIPGRSRHGFKIADDTDGPPMDPTTADRSPSPAAIDAARAFLARRFPGLAAARLVGAEVCQYEKTPDGHFILDGLDGDGHIWIAGGGSGHGFKMGPAIGDLMAACILDNATPPDVFRLARLDHEPAAGWEGKWGDGVGTGESHRSTP